MKLIYLGTLVVILGTFSFVYGDKVSYSVSSHSIMAIIGEDCLSSSDCVPANSFCSSSGSCECINGFIHDTTLQRCLKLAERIGDQCDESQQCQLGVPGPGPLSSCEVNPSNPTGNKICQCTSTAIGDSSGIACLRRATVVGDPCQEQIQCTGSLGSSYCHQNTCLCLPDAVPTPGNLMCLPKRWLSQVCQQSVECNHIGSADCHPVNISDPAAGMECRCNSGYINPPFFNNRCYQLANVINATCEHQIQCDNLDGSTCIGGRCQCPNGYLASTNRTRCLAESSRLNDTCQETVQCLVPSSECRITQTIVNPSMQCQCRQNEYVESQFNASTINTCIQVARFLNQECRENVQCVAGLGSNTLCTLNNLCQCKPGLGAFEQRCYSPARLEEVCQQHEQCFVGVNPLAMCALVNATTGLRLCRCQPVSVEFDAKCYAPKVVGASCQSHLECSVVIRGEVECDGVSGQCACKVGYSPTEDTVCSGALGVHLCSSSLALIMLIVKYFLL